MRISLFLLFLIFLGCNKQDNNISPQLDFDVLIDCSNGGGGWWYPQIGIYCNPSLDHQGKVVADTLKALGFTVYETCQGEHMITCLDNIKNLSLLIISAGGFQPYTNQANEKIIDFLNNGGNLLLLMDHSPLNSLSHALNLDFQKTNSRYVIIEFESHPITEGLPPSLYQPGVSAITNNDEGIIVLARLSNDTFLDINENGIQDPEEISNPIFMGAMHYGKGKIIFCGDINIWQQKPILIKNALRWFDLIE